MQQIILPGTSLQTSRLGFGTASLHHAYRSKDRQALLAAALDAGFTHFDTARMYGEGMAERALGSFLGARRQQLTIATKFGIPASAWLERVPPLLYANRALSSAARRLLRSPPSARGRRLTPEAAESSLTKSLRALRTDWVDILFLHEPHSADVAAVQGLADWLQRQKASGRVRYLGLAGQASVCVALNEQAAGLFDILQVEDSIAGREADALLAGGRPLQITFGYVRKAGSTAAERDAATVLRAALARNSRGMVLVSTRQQERLPELAQLVRQSPETAQ